MMFPLSSPTSVCSPGLRLSQDWQSSNSRALEEFSIVICLFEFAFQGWRSESLHCLQKEVCFYESDQITSLVLVFSFLSSLAKLAEPEALVAQMNDIAEMNLLCPKESMLKRGTYVFRMGYIYSTPKRGRCCLCLKILSFRNL